MPTVTIEDAQARLQQLIAGLGHGEELINTQNNQPMARLVVEPRPNRSPRRPGTLRGTVLYIAPDFDAPLEDFKEYME